MLQKIFEIVGLEYYQFAALLSILADRKLMELSTRNTLSLIESLLAFCFQSKLFYFLIVSLAMAAEDEQDISQCVHAALKQSNKKERTK